VLNSREWVSAFEQSEGEMMRSLTFVCMTSLALTPSGCNVGEGGPNRSQIELENAVNPLDVTQDQRTANRISLRAFFPVSWDLRVNEDGSGYLNFLSQPWSPGTFKKGTFSSNELKPVLRALQTDEPLEGAWSARVEFRLTGNDGTLTRRSGWMTDPLVIADLIEHLQSRVQEPDVLAEYLRRDPPVPIELLKLPG
jgi:hypothetical protein